MPAWLVEGPRGRRLLWELLRQQLDVPHPWRPTIDDVDDAVRGSAGLTWDGPQLLQAFADSVSWARYWQEPDKTDTCLDGAGDALRPLAARIVLPAWWESGVDPDAQVLLDWADGEGGEAPPTAVATPAGNALEQWREHVVRGDARARRERPADLRASWGGEWWSTPVGSGLASTSRREAGLQLVEDDLGWEAGWLTPTRLAGDIRVYEVRGPQDWVRLVEQHPLEVTASRRHDWWRAVGATGPLLIPDYRAVAGQWEGVHVSARGYLTTAGRALPVGGATAVLAGWDPDRTWWLADCVQPIGPAERIAVPRP